MFKVGDKVRLCGTVTAVNDNIVTIKPECDAGKSHDPINFEADFLCDDADKPEHDPRTHEAKTKHETPLEFGGHRSR